MSPDSVQARIHQAGLAVWRFLRFKHLLNSVLAHTPKKFNRWLFTKMMESKAVAGERFVPEKDYEEKCRAALEWLQSKSGGKPIGDYVEFGVCHGSSMACVHRMVKELSLENQVRLIGFDSFEGLPDTTGMEDSHIWAEGECRSDIRFTTRFLTKAGVDWSRTHLIKGWFSDTCNAATVDKYQMKHASLIMVDSDLYTSAKTALDFCGPLLGDHAVIFFDEWHIRDFVEKGLGEKRAFDEFLAAHPDFEIEDFGRYERRSQCFKVSRKKPAATVSPALAIAGGGWMPGTVEGFEHARTALTAFL